MAVNKNVNHNLGDYVPLEAQNIVNVEINKEMRNSFLDYSMSVITSRALPDVRDGLKPVHRRILYTMYENGLYPDKAYRKCADTVGSVLGRYHPHGDASVYDAMVRLAQNFSMRYVLVDGHGNFGSIDGDPAAAYRYTESRMSKIALEMLTNIDKDTVDFTTNYDDRLKEPTVLPSRYPNLLVNGSTGIAVGMATNIPPHNMSEVIDGVLMLIDNPDASVEELMTVIKGPDFPTGGLIMGTTGIRDAYTTGRGSVKMRAKAHIETMSNGKPRIVVTELPYQVNKARLIEKIAELARDKQIEGITDLRDESDRKGMSIVIELRKDINPDIMLNQLYKHTQLQDTFGVIMLALVDNQPRILTLKQVLHYYIQLAEIRHCQLVLWHWYIINLAASHLKLRRKGIICLHNLRSKGGQSWWNSQIHKGTRHGVLTANGRNLQLMLCPKSTQQSSKWTAPLSAISSQALKILLEGQANLIRTTAQSYHLGYRLNNSIHSTVEWAPLHEIWIVTIGHSSSCSGFCPNNRQLSHHTLSRSQLVLATERHKNAVTANGGVKALSQALLAAYIQILQVLQPCFLQIRSQSGYLARNMV